MLRHDLFVVLISQSVTRPPRRRRCRRGSRGGASRSRRGRARTRAGCRGSRRPSAAISGSRTRPWAVYALPEKPEPMSLASAARAMAFVGGEGRDIRRRDPARARPHPRHPVAGVRDDAGGEFGGHAFEANPVRRTLPARRDIAQRRGAARRASPLRDGAKWHCRSMDTITADEFRAAAGVDDWRPGASGALAEFRTRNFATGREAVRRHRRARRGREPSSRRRRSPIRPSA